MVDKGSVSEAVWGRVRTTSVGEHSLNRIPEVASDDLRGSLASTLL